MFLAARVPAAAPQLLEATAIDTRWARIVTEQILAREVPEIENEPTLRMAILAVALLEWETLDGVDVTSSSVEERSWSKPTCRCRRSRRSAPPEEEKSKKSSTLLGGLTARSRRPGSARPRLNAQVGFHPLRPRRVRARAARAERGAVRLSRAASGGAAIPSWRARSQNQVSVSLYLTCAPSALDVLAEGRRALVGLAAEDQRQAQVRRA